MKRLVSLLVIFVSLYGCARREAVTPKERLYEPKTISEADIEELDIAPEGLPAGVSFKKTDKLEDVFFDFDRSDIRDDARISLDRNAQWIKRYRPIILIEGHCDERGTSEYNLALGDRRAMAVKKYLILKGCDPDKIFTISYGEERPFNFGHNEEAWQGNRRAHFKVGIR